MRGRAAISGEGCPDHPRLRVFDELDESWMPGTRAGPGRGPGPGMTHGAPMDDDEHDDEYQYDPLVAPVPEEWIELDESERIWLIRDYHRRAGIALPDSDMHAM